jgi:peptide/nickel transport system substrate-binding protein
MVTVGNLATSWESVNPTTWRFHLRKGVKFHDGADFTAEDVAFSVDRIRSEGSDLKVIAGMIEEAKIIDDYTIDLITPAPDPILPIQLEIFYIMDKDWAEKHKTTTATNLKGGEEGNHANLNANGTGPFMLKEPRQSERQRHRPVHAQGAPAGRPHDPGPQS